MDDRKQLTEALKTFSEIESMATDHDASFSGMAQQLEAIAMSSVVSATVLTLYLKENMEQSK